MMRVYILLVCLLPLIICQAEAAPESKREQLLEILRMANDVQGKNQGSNKKKILGHWKSSAH